MRLDKETILASPALKNQWKQSMLSLEEFILKAADEFITNSKGASNGISSNSGSNGSARLSSVKNS